MVYYGALSKGCQSCRQRKIKACTFFKTGYPLGNKSKPKLKNSAINGGRAVSSYRDLTDLLFRDERQRIRRRLADDNGRRPQPSTLTTPPDLSMAPKPHLCNPGARTSSPYFHLPHQPVEEMAASFFFSQYTTTGPPYCDSYQSWLTKTYLDSRPNHMVRSAIQAVGMAALSNVCHAPYLAFQAKGRYGQALKATNLALCNTSQAKEDSTLMAIMLLVLFMTITFEQESDSHAWATHIEGANTLLQLRGKDQFTREIGIQLYIQFRNQILQACMHRGMEVPPGLVEVTMDFETSRHGKSYIRMRHESLAVIGFRLVNLLAAIKKHDITDPDKICQIAFDVNNCLQTWVSLQYHRNFVERDAEEPSISSSFNGKRHVYESAWGAQIWNDWRSLGIVMNRIILDYVDEQSFENDALKQKMRYDSVTCIQRLSTDICISTSSLSGSPRAASMIWPLHIVSQETINTPKVRFWAIERLRDIRKSMGIKQAAVLADNVKIQKDI
ncbi:fungal specific transcription factor domain-containing protein [Colletotrichum incanum]|nr:fungal specific transcription factor domain-containing protein [Colletotrichum incanum]